MGPIRNGLLLAQIRQHRVFLGALGAFGGPALGAVLQPWVGPAALLAFLAVLERIVTHVC